MWSKTMERQSARGQPASLLQSSSNCFLASDLNSGNPRLADKNAVPIKKIRLKCADAPDFSAGRITCLHLFTVFTCVIPLAFYPINSIYVFINAQNGLQC